ncbi:MAG: leucine-rich repeat protein [Lachnospiraceae bacterium]|nr:leucine-rich repeat protein [Lachnospiraceae bacterium]
MAEQAAFSEYGKRKDRTMSEYIDDKYLVLDGVLLNYKSKEKLVVVPSSVNGVPIHTIGKGAFAFHTLEGVVISDGIKRINYRAFAECRNLRYVGLGPSVEFVGENAFETTSLLEKVKQIIVCDAAEYQRLKDNSICDGGSRYLSYELPKSGRIFYLTEKAFFGLGKTHRLPRGLKRLFVTHRDIRKGPAIFDCSFGMVPELQNIFWPADSREMDEKEALKCLEKEGFPAPDPEMERWSSTLVGGRPSHIGMIETNKSMVFLFDDLNTRMVGDRYCVIGEYDIGYHFWQSLQPEGKDAGGSKFEGYLKDLWSALEGTTGGKKTVYKRCVLGASANPYYDKLDYISFPTGYYPK